MSGTTEEKKFLASYYHRDSWWAVEIYAVDWDDAETICRKLSLRLDGEYKFSIPAGNSWLANLVCWFNNKKAGNET